MSEIRTKERLKLRYKTQLYIAVDGFMNAYKAIDKTEENLEDLAGKWKLYAIKMNHKQQHIKVNDKWLLNADKYKLYVDLW